MARTLDSWGDKAWWVTGARGGPPWLQMDCSECRFGSEEPGQKNPGGGAQVARIVQKLDLLAEGRVATAGALPTGQPSTGALDILQDSAAAIKTEGGSAVKGEHGWKDEEDLGDWGKDPATVPEQATSKKVGLETVARL